MQNMIPKRKERGFTLIELVMVIVILGILAAFALPRFADLGGEAEKAAVEGARGSVKSSLGIVRSTALAEGKGSTTTADLAVPIAADSVSLEGTDIGIVNGYLAAEFLDDAAQLDDFLVVVDTPDAYVTITGPSEDSPCFNFTGSTAPNTPATVGALSTMNAAADACD